MAVNKLIQTHAKIKTAVFILLVLFPFLYMMMGTTVQAAEGGTENKHYTFKSTLDSIAGSDWGKEQRSDIRLINDDVYGTEADTVKESAQSPVPGDDQKPDSDKKPDDDAVKKPTAGIANVSRLKITSSTKKVMLSWKKIPEAEGYVIYQYNRSEKSWTEKAALKTNTASYTVKGLTPATGYRFAVKAYTQDQNGKRIVSGSYTSAYTATAPDIVNFKITPGKKKATVKWSKVKGATGYKVYYKTKLKDLWKKVKTTKGKSCTKTKLKSGKTYYFTVKAYKTYKGKTYTSSFFIKKVKIK